MNKKKCFLSSIFVFAFFTAKDHNLLIFDYKKMTSFF